MAIIVGGHEQGLLDSSANISKRTDRLDGGTLARGDELVTNVSNGNLVVQERDRGTLAASCTA